ncbi:hypothetical protein D3C78_1938710 [compost metagenome]
MHGDDFARFVTPAWPVVLHRYLIHPPDLLKHGHVGKWAANSTTGKEQFAIALILETAKRF